MEIRLLVVDDDPAVREALRTYLSSEGYRVELAADGEEALAMHRQAPYDLILLDERMPNRSGLETVHALHARHDTVPILLMTAFVDDMTRHKDEGLRQRNFIAKPFEPEEIAERIAALLNDADQKHE